MQCWFSKSSTLLSHLMCNKYLKSPKIFHDIFCKRPLVITLFRETRNKLWKSISANQNSLERYFYCVIVKYNLNIENPRAINGQITLGMPKCVSNIYIYIYSSTFCAYLMRNGNMEELVSTYGISLKIEQNHGLVIVNNVCPTVILPVPQRPTTLQWRHNEREVSQITDVSIVCSTVCSGLDQRKHQSSASLVFVREIYRWIPLTKGQ